MAGIQQLPTCPPKLLGEFDNRHDKLACRWLVLSQIASWPRIRVLGTIYSCFFPGVDLYRWVDSCTEEDILQMDLKVDPSVLDLVSSLDSE